MITKVTSEGNRRKCKVNFHANFFNVCEAGEDLKGFQVGHAKWIFGRIR